LKLGFELRHIPSFYLLPVFNHCQVQYWCFYLAMMRL